MLRAKLFGLVAAFLLLLGILVPQAAVYGYDPLQDACTGQNQSASCNSRGDGTDNPLTGTNGTIVRVANMVAIIAGAAAIIMIVVSGIRYVLSGGDAQATSNAKKGVISALVGLAVIVLARALISLVVKGLSP